MIHLPRFIAATKLPMATAAGLVASVVLCRAICTLGESVAPAAESRPLTLWSGKIERTGGRNSIAEGVSTDAPLYRLPPPESVKIDAGRPIVNRIARHSERIAQTELQRQWPPAAQTTRAEDPNQQGIKSPTATTASTNCADTEVVDHLPVATAPRPPSLVSRRPGKTERPYGSAKVLSIALNSAAPSATAGSKLPQEPVVVSQTPAVVNEEREQPRPVAVLSTSPSPQIAYTPPNTPTIARVGSQVEPAISKAYSLAQRGALYAAREELIDVLRRIAHARDAAFHTHGHVEALAEGLRALQEADDFVPAGVQLETELVVTSISRCHRTAVLHNAATDVLPHDAVAAYHDFAHRRLGQAVGEDQAGSMVLYALGRIYDGMAQRADDDLQSTRKGMTMYRAALVSHSGNYLAANELGVLMARSGHYQDALWLFERVVRQAPHAAAYHNLAIVQWHLGDHVCATHCQQEAMRLAHLERATGMVSRRQGIDFVTPAELARVGQPSQIPAAGPMVATTTPSARQPRSPATVPAIAHDPQQKRTSISRRMKWPWQRDSGDDEAALSLPVRIARPAMRIISAPPFNPRMDPVPSQTFVR